MPTFVLGIDAAWTDHHPSGVALVRVPSRGRPRLLRLARSYEEFCSNSNSAHIDWATKVHGSSPDIPALLAACERITGARPRAITLDIPLGSRPITGRRAADNMVTRIYINRRAGTHTPTAMRPGPISRKLFEQLTDCGFTWLNADPALARHQRVNPKNRNNHVFMEAYPHPAIIELLGLNERLKYKVSKLQKYWPELDREARWSAVAKALDRLRQTLARHIKDVTKWLPLAHSFVAQGHTSWLKGYEDAIDAIVCAWIGCEFLAGRCVVYGDVESAIWLPRPRHRSKKIQTSHKSTRNKKTR